MPNISKENFQFENRVPPVESELEAAFNNMQVAYEKVTNSQPCDPDEILNNIYKIDSMGRATSREALRAWRVIGKAKVIEDAVDSRINVYDGSDRSIDVLRVIRVGYLMGYTRRPLLESLRSLRSGHTSQAAQREDQYIVLYDKHYQKMEDQRKAAEAKIQAEKARKEAEEAKKKAREERLKETVWEPAEPDTGKTPEWLVVQQEARRKWTNLRSRGVITTERSPMATLKRFNSFMDLLHEEISKFGVSDESKTNACRAIAEALYREVWTAPVLVSRFLNDPTFSRFTSNPVTVDHLSKISQALFVSSTDREQKYRDPSNPATGYYENLTTLIRQMKKNWKILAFTFHPDRNDPDINKNLNEYAYPFMLLLSTVVNDRRGAELNF